MDLWLSEFWLQNEDMTEEGEIEGRLDPVFAGFPPCEGEWMGRFRMDGRWLRSVPIGGVEFGMFWMECSSELFD